LEDLRETTKNASSTVCVPTLAPFLTPEYKTVVQNIQHGKATYMKERNKQAYLGTKTI
jgi:hypothetical protein